MQYRKLPKGTEQVSIPLGERNLSGLRRKNIMLGNFSYSNPTKLYFGEDSLCSLNE